MLEDGDPMDRSRADAPSVRLDLDHWDCRRACLLLEAAGGRRIPGDASVFVYRFPCGAARDEALDLVRRRFGWTIAAPVDGGP